MFSLSLSFSFGRAIVQLRRPKAQIIIGRTRAIWWPVSDPPCPVSARYGRVQSVKLLSADGAAGPAATVAFIDIKSAAKAHNAENRVEERPLLTEYYDPNGRPPPADEPPRPPPAGVGGYPAGRGRGAGFSRG